MGDRLTTGALLAAFGSEHVRSKHRSWLAAVDRATSEIERLSFYAQEDYAPPSEPAMRELETVLIPAEVGAREILANAIAHELGHRVNPWWRRWLRQLVVDRRPLIRRAKIQDPDPRTPSGVEAHIGPPAWVPPAGLAGPQDAALGALVTQNEENPGSV